MNRREDKGKREGEEREKRLNVAFFLAPLIA